MACRGTFRLREREAWNSGGCDGAGAGEVCCWWPGRHSSRACSHPRTHGEGGFLDHHGTAPPLRSYGGDKVVLFQALLLGQTLARIERRFELLLSLVSFFVVFADPATTPNQQGRGARRSSESAGEKNGQQPAPWKGSFIKVVQRGHRQVAGYRMPADRKTVR